MTTPDIYSDAYYDVMRPLYGSFLELVKELPLADLKILDAGCGPGELLVQLAACGARNLHGLDFSAAAVRQSQARLSRACTNGQEFSVVCSSIDARDAFAENSFDLVLMTDIVEHLPQPILEAGLANVRYWLKPGGRVIIHTFPTLGPHRLYQTFLKTTGREQTLKELNEIHCNVQTRKSLCAALSKVGLTVDKLWLRNDLKMASSVYHGMPEGPLKKLIGFLADDLLNHPLIARASALFGLSEFVSPSIYLYCTKRTVTRGSAEMAAMSSARK